MLRERVLYLADRPNPTLQSTLRAAGMEVCSRPLETTPGLAALLRPDRVIVDGTQRLGLALAIIRELVELTGLPVLVLLGSPSESVECMALAAGARQIATQTTSGRLVVSRLRALYALAAEQRILEVGPLRLLCDERHLLCHDRGVTLSGTEFVLLEAFMHRPKHVLTRSSLMRLGWAEPCSERALESTLSHLRRRVLAADGPRIILPMRGIGYRLGLDPVERR